MDEKSEMKDMTLATMSKDERSLLLYLETRAVDYGGKVDVRHMNSDDMAIAKIWNKSGFLGFGRVASEDCSSSGAHWCRLTDEAWRLAHEERRARAARMYAQRTWKTTEEKRKGE